MNKSLGFDVADIKKTIEEIEFNLLYTLNINVNNGMFVDNGNPILIDGKTIRYPKVDAEFLERSSINFDPFMNRKLAHYLFQRYAILRQMENPNFNVSSFFITSDLTNPLALFAVCRTNFGEYSSFKFTNETVCWIDLIHKMDGDDKSYNTMINIDSLINFERSIQEANKRL